MDLIIVLLVMLIIVVEVATTGGEGDGSLERHLWDRAMVCTTSAGTRLDHRHLRLGSSFARATCLGHNPHRPGGPIMGSKTDKIIGRAKQALGAVTGNETMKSEGQRQEDKGRLKGKIDSTIGKAQGALDDLKDKADRS
jgi:uncharacterized protein YjbJ (UPF0337 family)